jgi:hypothetical protein
MVDKTSADYKKHFFQAGERQGRKKRDGNRVKRDGNRVKSEGGRKGSQSANEICGTPLLLPQLTFLTVESRNPVSLDYRECTSSPGKYCPTRLALWENCPGRQKVIYRYVNNYLHQTGEARARLFSPLRGDLKKAMLRILWYGMT